MKVSLKKSGEFPNQEQLPLVKDFIKSLKAQLPLNKDIGISFTDKRDVNMTTGVRMSKHQIHILTKGRLLIDILRTLAHEWTHEYQYQKMGIKYKIKDIGGPEENMCNILSGIFVKKFVKNNPKSEELFYGDRLDESIINEISPRSSGVNDFLEFMKRNPNYMNDMGFRNYDRLEDYVYTANYEEFSDLLNELEELTKKKRSYIDDEMDEIERAVQDLSRDGSLETTVQDVTSAFINASETDLTKNIWSKLENTESNEIKKGEMKKVENIAKKYNKTNPSILKKALLKNQYERPLIIKFGNRYHLVAGNTRLCTAAALGMTPKVLIAEI